MSEPTASLLAALYPARWRARYGEEFIDLLFECPATPAVLSDVGCAAVTAHLWYRAAERRAGVARRLQRRRATLIALLVLAPAPVSIRGVGPSPRVPSFLETARAGGVSSRRPEHATSDAYLNDGRTMPRMMTFCANRKTISVGSEASERAAMMTYCGADCCRS